MLLFNSRRVRISVGFCLLLAWFSLANGGALLLSVLGAAAVHEMGHCLALWSCGGRVRCLRLSVFGAVMETDCRRLSYGKEIAALLAGPAANLVGAFTAAGLRTEWGDVFTGANLALCLFNLLPVRPLDGGRVLELLCACLWSEEAGEWAARVSGLCISLLMCLLLSLLVWRTGGNLWLIPAAVGFGLAAWRESCGK